MYAEYRANLTFFVPALLGVAEQSQNAAYRRTDEADETYINDSRPKHGRASASAAKPGGERG
jgi:hypothetical protein